ncbi:unnamed protein product [Cochlearia groenlandica]
MTKQSPNTIVESLEGLMNLTLETQVNAKVNGSRHKDQPMDIEHVEKILNYEFENKSLLLEAFTDTTYDENCVSYERLEFIGDTVLNLVITKVICEIYYDSPPGLLTNLRAVNVDTEKLARVAIKHNLHRYLRHKKPLLEEQVVEFSKAIEEYPLHSRGLLKVPKCLADIVESTIGAIALDCNYSFETISKVVKPLLEPIITLDKLMSHPMTQLNEMCQKKNLKLRFDDSNWENDKNIIVFIEERKVGRGHHLIKKDSARNIAAKNAIENFPIYFQEL